MTLEQDFRAAYEELSEKGACDSPDGMEYERVFSEWIAAGKPADARTFIRWRANASPWETKVMH